MNLERIQRISVWLRVKMADERGEYGMGTVISIAIGLIVTSFIILPELRNFSTTIMTKMDSWWADTVVKDIFPTTITTTVTTSP
ncbi:MAG: hypothetical protein PWP38_1978 [Clostridiales bacterium]|jgi:hypothetical protein|nr:hypothetical protein [Clostridiales bacterium]